MSEPVRPNSAKPPASDLPTMERLPNGLTLITDHMPHVDSVAVGVWVNAGARSERADEHGMAHFLEHMAFKGTERRSARDISNAIEAVGGEINAATSHETTAFHARMLAEDLPLALDILADILVSPRFDPSEVERERNVILQEIGAAEDVPEERAFDAFPEAAFAGQPLGRRILGSRGSVSSVTADGLRGFLQRHYTAPALTVVAAGAVDHERLRDDVLENFGNLASADPDVLDTADYVGGTHEEAFDSAEVQWLLGFEGRPARHADAMAVNLAAMVMGGGLSSRLFQALREERGLVYDTSAFHWSFRDTGVFAIHFATECASAADAAQIVLEQLDAAADRITHDELERVKSQSRAGLLMARESCASRMSQAARHATVFGRPIPKEERIAQIDATTADDVVRVLRDMIATPPTLVRVGAEGEHGPDADAISKRFGAAAQLRGAA